MAAHLHSPFYLFLWGLLFSCIGICWYIHFRKIRIEREGLIATGTVLVSESKTKSYHAEIKYRDDKDREWTHSSSRLPPEGSPYPVGSNVKIFYLSGKPESARTQADIDHIKVIWFRIAFWTGCAICMFLFADLNIRSGGDLHGEP